MATRDYCSNVAEELESWSEKLHNLSDEIDRIPTGDKQRLFPQIEKIHILMTELDDRLCELMDSCSTVETGPSKRVRSGVAPVGKESRPEGTEKFDYEIGG